MTRLILPLLLLISAVTQAAPAPKEKFHLYVLAGQSNMAGRGTVEEVDKTPHPRVFMFTEKGEWTPAVEPLHFDKPAVAGVGPGLAFAKTLADADPSITIGLIPCAVGGTPLSSWQPKAVDPETKTTPYDTAVARAKLAAKDGVIKGILWHQGESDANEKSAPKYGDTLEKTLGKFRDQLGDNSIAIVVGELGQFIVDKNPQAARINLELSHFPMRFSNCAFVSAAGLKDKGDQTHFDSASQREFGKRYAQAILDLQKRPKPTVIKLWPDGLPDGKPLDKPEENNAALIGHVSEPTLSIFSPDKSKSTGAAVVICPGGGYYILAFEKEGENVARWLADSGVTAIVLKNRLRDYPQPAPLRDAQQALRVTRENAAKWGVDEHKVGILGFSAGGHLAGYASNAEPVTLEPESYKKYNAINCRPDFSILIYSVLPPVGDKWVKEMYTPITPTAKTPPAFLVSTKDDPVPCRFSIGYAQALTDLKIPNELHLYEKGGHGYGLGQSGGEVAQWPGECEKWLRSMGMIK